jgi:hypothetical protein
MLVVEQVKGPVVFVVMVFFGRRMRRGVPSYGCWQEG